MQTPAQSAPTPRREPLPKRFCNLERLLHAMAARGLDGIVATTVQNVFYLSGFNAIAHKSDEPRRGARAAYRSSIRKVYEADPLQCPKCRSVKSRPMRPACGGRTSMD